MSRYVGDAKANFTLVYYLEQGRACRSHHHLEYPFVGLLSDSVCSSYRVSRYNGSTSYEYGSASVSSQI